NRGPPRRCAAQRCASAAAGASSGFGSQLDVSKGKTGMKKLGMLMGGACAFVLAQAAMAGQAGPSDPKAVEAAFDAGVSSQDQLDWLKDMSSAPNQVGSPHDKANAEVMLAKRKQWGWDARIET